MGTANIVRGAFSSPGIFLLLFFFFFYLGIPYFSRSPPSILEPTPATCYICFSLRYMDNEDKEDVLSWQWSSMACSCHMKGHSPYMWCSLESISFPSKEILCTSLDNQFQEEHSGANIFFLFMIVHSSRSRLKRPFFLVLYSTEYTVNKS